MCNEYLLPNGRTKLSNILMKISNWSKNGVEERNYLKIFIYYISIGL